MTTTEWVGRYNEAFEQAGLFQSHDSKFIRGPAYFHGTFKRLPPIIIRPKSIPGGEEFCLDDPWKLLPAVYRQFEPKEVVDDG